MMKRMMMILLTGMVCLTKPSSGQQKTDTVIVSLGKTSQVIFTMRDRSDLEILKHYNFQDLFSDILVKLERSGTTGDTVTTQQEQPVADADTSNEETSTTEEDWTGGRRTNDDDDDDRTRRDNDDDDYEDWRDYRREYRDKYRRSRGRMGRTWQSFNFDLGTNNYLADGKIKDTIFSVRPWGSWYFAASSIQRTRIGRNFFLEWGIGVSWYNFKFQNDDVMLERDDQGVEFVTDTRDLNHKKSKLTATYINASFIPVIDFGGYNRKPRMWDGYRSSFRIGFGPYVGYRIGSRTKMVYTEDGDLEKEKKRNSYYLENLRYGARLQLGFHGTDLFFNYDLNELFAANKGPKLNAFSFGVIF